MNKQQRGFSLIELMLTLVVVGVLASYAIPSFSQLLKDNQLRNASNELLGALNYARVEAVYRKRDVYVTPYVGTDFGQGVLVWVDKDNDSTKDVGETIRFDFEGQKGVVSTTTLTNIGFKSTGLLVGTSSATITFCDDRSNETGYQIDVSLSGRAQLSTKNDC